MQRIRQLFAERGDISAKKMCGGMAFLHCGSMCCYGVVDDKLIARAKQYRDVLQLQHVRKRDSTGKPLIGFVSMAPAGFEGGCRFATKDLVLRDIARTLSAKQ